MEHDDDTIELRLGREELTIRHRYEMVSIANDIALGLWFTVGSIMFFSESMMTTGTWLFLLGSLQMLMRPLIRLARSVHLSRMPHVHGGSHWDF